MHAVRVEQCCFRSRFDNGRRPHCRSQSIMISFCEAGAMLPAALPQILVSLTQLNPDKQLMNGDEVMVVASSKDQEKPVSVFVHGNRFPVKKEYGWDKFKANVSRMAGKGKEQTLLFSEESGDPIESFGDIEDGMKIEVRTELTTIAEKGAAGTNGAKGEEGAGEGIAALAAAGASVKKALTPVKVHYNGKSADLKIDRNGSFDGIRAEVRRVLDIVGDVKDVVLKNEQGVMFPDALSIRDGDSIHVYEAKGKEGIRILHAQGSSEASRTRFSIMGKVQGFESLMHEAFEAQRKAGKCFAGKNEGWMVVSLSYTYSLHLFTLLSRNFLQSRLDVRRGGSRELASDLLMTSIRATVS